MGLCIVKHKLKKQIMAIHLEKKVWEIMIRKILVQKRSACFLERMHGPQLLLIDMSRNKKRGGS